MPVRCGIRCYSTSRGNTFEMLGGECGGAMHHLSFLLHSFDCYCFQWIPRANPRGRDALVSPLRAVTESCPPHRTSLLRVLAVLCSPQFCSALLLLHIVCFLVDRSVAVLLVVDCSRRSFRSTTRPACCCRCGLSHAVSHLKSRAAVIEECACVRPLTEEDAG